MIEWTCNICQRKERGKMEDLLEKGWMRVEIRYGMSKPRKRLWVPRYMFKGFACPDHEIELTQKLEEFLSERKKELSKAKRQT